MNASGQDRPILYFDGVCNLCNSFVQFVIRHDKQKRFMFASLQSEAGARALADMQQKNNKAIPDSMVLYYNGKYYVKSSAALQAARLLGGVLSLSSVFMVVPAFIRNPVYDLIARNRYKWFGKQDSCMMPTPDLQSRLRYRKFLKTITKRCLKLVMFISGFDFEYMRFSFCKSRRG
jgi:predicted DCC family thiol-disulfide oxidoreductase YuxK